MKSIAPVIALVAAVCGSLMFAGGAAAQQVFPNKPIRIVIPYAPGGSGSVLVRLIGRKLSESWGQSVIVDERPGGNTIIGSELVVKAPPDGYTILENASTHVINPHLFRTPYDALKDFAPVATMAKSELVLAVHPSVPANNLHEFIALAKSKPGVLNYSSGATGGPPHLATEFFNDLAGVKTQHIPYKGGGPAIIALLGGEVQLSFVTPPVVAEYVKSGRLKVLATSGETRLAGLPDVPTFTQAGLPGLDVKFWYGLFAPAATPRDVINKFSAEVGKVLAMPDVKENLGGQGLEPFISTPDQFAALLSADYSRYGMLIKKANIKVPE